MDAQFYSAEEKLISVYDFLVFLAQKYPDPRALDVMARIGHILNEIARDFPWQLVSDIWDSVRQTTYHKDAVVYILFPKMFKDFFEEERAEHQGHRVYWLVMANASLASYGGFSYRAAGRISQHETKSKKALKLYAEERSYDMLPQNPVSGQFSYPEYRKQFIIVSELLTMEPHERELFVAVAPIGTMIPKIVCHHAENKMLDVCHIGRDRWQRANAHNSLSNSRGMNAAGKQFLEYVKAKIMNGEVQQMNI